MTPSPTAFAQNASADDLTVLAAVQRPLRFSCMTVPTAGPVLWKKVPTWYLVAEHDRMIVPATQRFMAERMKATIKSHAVDHAPIVTAPAPVVDIIREAVQSVAATEAAAKAPAISRRRAQDIRTASRGGSDGAYQVPHS